MVRYNKCVLFIYAGTFIMCVYIWNAIKTPLVENYETSAQPLLPIESQNSQSEQDGSQSELYSSQSSHSKFESVQPQTTSASKVNFNGPCRNEEACCLKIMANDSKSIEWAKSVTDLETDREILTDLDNCDTFFRKRQYTWGPSTSYTTDESKFPLAFSILAHLDLLHVERLLKLIYQPQNLYCVHVDNKSVDLQEKVQKLARCFPNVVVTQKRETVFWGGFGVLKATVNCLDELVNYENKSHTWEYFINLSAQDFPLRTNLELVETLRTWGGDSNVEILNEDKKWKFKFHHEIKYNKFGNADANVKTSKIKGPPPKNMTIYKGNLAVVLARELADWIVESDDSKRLLNWLSDTDVADEHFWATVIKNKDKYDISSSYHHPSFTVVEPYVARYALWKTANDSANCGGRFLHDVCIFGVADINGLTKLPHFFVNKFHMSFQPMAYKCMERWHRSRRETEVFLVEKNAAVWA